MHEQPVGAERFTVAVPDDVLKDLRERLVRTRLPTVEPKAAPWFYGAKLAYVRDMVAYWRDAYDWRRAEAGLNRFPQSKAPIDGKQVHFILERGS